MMLNEGIEKMTYIKINNATKIINKEKVLDDITIEMEKGKVYGLYGKNGSGKTMLMRAICGLIRLSKGTIMINNEILGKDISFPRSIGVLLENPSFISYYSGKKNLQYLANIKKQITDKEIDSALERVGLDSNNKKHYKKYSLGMKQRLGIAAVIMEKPDLLIFDEPTNALDGKGIELINEIIQQEKERGATIIIACHDTEELEYLADEIFDIKEGKVYKRESEFKA